MANYQLKYWYTFVSQAGLFYKVEILEDSISTITAVEVDSGPNPFSVEYPTVKNKLDTIRGSGCDINLISATNLQFTSLYTNDIFKYQVNFYDHNNNIIWCGYTTSETYREPFNELENYPVQITATDGFALLDRIYFVDSSGNNFTDIKTYWDIIKIIINKLNLPINCIFTALSTSISGISTASNETIFHKQYAICTNFIDEDGQAFTCRDVLEAVLKPFACFIQQIGGNIYITDHNVTYNSSSTFKQWDGTTFNYVQDTTINLNIGDLSSIGFASNSQNSDVINGINKQKVRYSPYRLTNIIDYTSPDSDFSTQDSSTSYGTSPYRWCQTNFTGSGTWTAYNNGKFKKLEGIDVNNVKEKDFYLDIPRYTGDSLNELNGYTSSCKSFTYKKILPYLIPSGYKLKISCQVYARKVDDLENPGNVPNELFGLGLLCDLKIGNKKFVIPIRHWANNVAPNQNYPNYTKSKLLGGEWKDLSDSGCMQLDFRQSLTYKSTYATVNWMLETPIEDQWVSLEDYQYQYYYYQPIVKDYIISLDGVIGGQMTFDIYKWDAYKKDFDDSVQNVSNNVIWDATLDAKIKDVRIKDIKITLIDINGNEVVDNDNDVEYTASLDKRFKDEGSQIKLINGTNTTLNPTERGSILSYDGTKYNFIQNWTREGKTTNIESLLLRSIVSNYTDPSKQLTLTSNLINSHLGYITYNNYLSGKKFMITGIRQNYRDNESELNIVEFNKDNLEIYLTY